MRDHLTTRAGAARQPVLYGGIMPYEEKQAERGISFIIGAAEFELHDDQQFFARRPERRHRIRRAFPAEFFVHQASQGCVMQPPAEELAPHVVVGRIWDEVRRHVLFRFFFWALPTIDAPALCESACRNVFDCLRRRFPIRVEC
jgi:hypothetical protein